MSGIVFGLLTGITALSLRAFINNVDVLVTAVAATSFVWGSLMAMFLAHSIYTKALKKGTSTSVL